MANPLVTIPEGQVRGNQRINLDGKHFYSFLGIPYAKSPIGELRFKAPEPVEPWSGIKDATKGGDQCYHKHEYLFTTEGSENCLHLNVFTKTLPSEDAKLKPVMVWIHGGAFLWGSNNVDLYGPEHLMTEDIVLVSINYRLGVLGFLRLEDSSLDINGNAGLKDQQLALKWVQKNIRNFNGDPANVTIFGESAGSASVHLHLVSPSSKGLFHRAIMQSGTTFNPWSIARNPGLEFARSMKADIKTEKEALEYLRQLKVEDLYAHQKKFCDANGVAGVAGPTIEKPNKTAFLTSRPVDLISSGQYNKVPILLGYNTREGLLLEAMNIMQKRQGLEPPFKVEETKLEDLVHPHMLLDKNDPKVATIVSKYKECYFRGKNASDPFMLIGDQMFVSGIVGAAKLHAKTSQYPVYLYRMSLDAGMNVIKKVIGLVEPGVIHADDLGYLFRMRVVEDKLQRGEFENGAIRRFVKLWTNFAKTGNPTPDGNDLNVVWKPVDQNQINFLDIGRELSMHSDPESDRMKIWHEIFQLSEATVNYL